LNLKPECVRVNDLTKDIQERLLVWPKTKYGLRLHPSLANFFHTRDSQRSSKSINYKRRLSNKTLYDGMLAF